MMHFTDLADLLLTIVNLLLIGMLSGNGIVVALSYIQIKTEPRILFAQNMILIYATLILGALGGALGTFLLSRQIIQTTPDSAEILGILILASGAGIGAYRATLEIGRWRDSGR